MTQQQQVVTVAEEAEADDFDAMMTALDIFFHAHRVHTTRGLSAWPPTHRRSKPSRRTAVSTAPPTRIGAERTDE